jgi:hypothetical protein
VVSDNPARAVYGTIVAGALLAAESAKQETYPKTVAAVVIALVVYWLAHTYSDLAGEQLSSGQRLTVDAIVDSGRSELPILIGAALPLTVLIILWIAGTSLQDAITAAVWSCAGMIVLIQIIAGVRSELTGRALVGQVAFGALLGLLVVALKIVLH